MQIISYFQSSADQSVPILLLIGMAIILSFCCGKMSIRLRLPSIIGYMLFGVMLGPSFLNIFSDTLQDDLSFITEIALGFVALTIGLELNLNVLKKQGFGIISVIFAESFGAFFLVTAGIYWVTHDWALALIFGSIAPASAPAGTIAVIKEYKAKGSLTKALYTVVGFDDGLGIIIFSFASAIVRNMLYQQTGGTQATMLAMFLPPMKEIVLSIAVGALMSWVFCSLARRLTESKDVFVLLTGSIFAIIGLSKAFHLSLILTNMIAGMIIVNTQPDNFIRKLNDKLPDIMPLLFILFFTLAGSHLHIDMLSSLGLIGIVYVITRSSGLIVGSRIGASIGKVEEKIKKYIGLGILSQAGVAIGLSLTAKHEFQGLGKIVGTIDGRSITSGDNLGAIVLTTITATCIVFELIGPILTRIALKKSGEIS